MWCTWCQCSTRLHPCGRVSCNLFEIRVKDLGTSIKVWHWSHELIEFWKDDITVSLSASEKTNQLNSHLVCSHATVNLELSWLGRYGHFTCKGSMCVGTTCFGLNESPTECPRKVLASFFLRERSWQSPSSTPYCPKYKSIYIYTILGARWYVVDSILNSLTRLPNLRQGASKVCRPCWYLTGGWAEAMDLQAVQEVDQEKEAKARSVFSWCGPQICWPGWEA